MDLPLDITILPQVYTVHCIQNRGLGLSSSTVKLHYYSEHNGEISSQYCSNQYLIGYHCSVTTNNTVTAYSNTFDVSLRVEWEGEEVTNGTFSHSEHDGDHVHLCTSHNNRRSTITVHGRMY